MAIDTHSAAAAEIIPQSKPDQLITHYRPTRAAIPLSFDTCSISQPVVVLVLLLQLPHPRIPSQNPPPHHPPIGGIINIITTTTTSTTLLWLVLLYTHCKTVFLYYHLQLLSNSRGKRVPSSLHISRPDHPSDDDDNDNERSIDESHTAATLQPRVLFR